MPCVQHCVEKLLLPHLFVHGDMMKHLSPGLCKVVPRCVHVHRVENENDHSYSKSCVQKGPTCPEGQSAWALAPSLSGEILAAGVHQARVLRSPGRNCPPVSVRRAKSLESGLHRGARGGSHKKNSNEKPATLCYVSSLNALHSQS